MASVWVGIQSLICSLLALCVMFLSYWRRNFIQTVLAGAVIFVIPLALYVQGIDFMGYLTVYPVYTLLFTRPCTFVYNLLVF